MVVMKNLISREFLKETLETYFNVIEERTTTGILYKFIKGLRKELIKLIDDTPTEADLINDMVEIAKDDFWIPCTKGLPKEGQSVICTHANGLVIDHVYVEGEFVTNWPLEPRPYPDVVAWQPFPKAWKGVKNEDT